MINQLHPMFPSIEKLLDNYGLSTNKLPDDIELWKQFLVTLEKHEQQVELINQSVVDIPGAVVFISDLSLNIVGANENAVQFLGVENKNQLIGKHTSELLSPEANENIEYYFKKILAGETVPAYQRPYQLSDGTIIISNVKLDLVENYETGLKFFRCVAWDVTELNKVQELAKRNQIYLKNVLENAPIVLWACDKDGNITLSLGHALEGIGRKEGESIGTNVFTTYADNAQIIEHLKKALKGETQHIQVELGNIVFDSWYQPMRENEQVSGIIGVATDITELAQTQRRIQAIQESTKNTRDYLQAILNNSSDGIAVATLSGKIEQTNPAFNQLFNIQPDEAFGLQLYQYIEVSEESILEHTMDFVKRERKSLRFEALSVNDSQENKFHLDVSCSPILTETYEIKGLIFSIRDISAYQELLQNLAESRDEALQTSRLKSDFLAMMSHEVRTPLHAIMGVAEMVQDTNLEAEQSELIDLIQEQSQNLLTMLNSILDYSKLEAQKMILERRAFKVKDFMETVTNQFKGQAWNKGIELQIFIDAPDNLYIYGDAQRLRQVITAFASNAIKFTNEGSVIITCILLEKTETQATLHFGVADTGIGIPEEKIPTLFSPFTQADNSHTRRYGGTGLGLAITHRILKLMKSTIQVTSIVNDGTAFEFEINFDLAIASNAI